MQPFPVATLRGGQERPLYIGGGVYAFGSSAPSAAAAIPAAARAGDIVLFMAAGPSGATPDSTTPRVTTPPGVLVAGWVQEYGSYSFNGPGIAWKRVTVGDLDALRDGSHVVRLGNARLLGVAVYRNVQAVFLRRTAHGSNTDQISTPGLTKRPELRGLVGFQVHLNNSASGLSIPAGFSARGIASAGDSSATLTFGDQLDPTKYADATSFNFSGNGSTGWNNCGVVELLAGLSGGAPEAAQSLPLMTANDAPAGHAVSASGADGGGPPWHAFDDYSGTYVRGSYSFNGETWSYNGGFILQRDLPASILLGELGLRTDSAYGGAYAPASVEVRGWDGFAWVPLLQKSGLNAGGWPASELRRHAIPRQRWISCSKYQVELRNGGDTFIGDVLLYKGTP